MKLPDPKSTMSYFFIRTPYDAKADMERYAERLRIGGKMAEGDVPPAVGVSIRQMNANEVLRDLRANISNTRLEDVVREESARMEQEIKDALEQSIITMIIEVGVDPETLKYTAELNKALFEERKKWMDLYYIKEAENNRLECEIIRLRGQLLRLSGDKGVKV